MHIAIMGTRGIPPMYGGFETMAWELSTRFAEGGHQVTVYCRRGRTDESRVVPRGIRRRFLPAVHGKYVETVSHTAFSVVDSLVHPYDVVILANAANAILAAVPRLRGARVVLNVDGIERQRMKWGPAGRLWYALGERFALMFPDVIVADARVISDYYRRRYRRRTELIAYGATLVERAPPPDLGRLGLGDVAAGEYILYVSRLEPENQALMVMEAYRQVGGDHPLLIVGDAPYASEYKAKVREAAARDPRVRIPGAIYGSGYADLQRGAMAYVQATSVGGTHPALIEAMAAGNLVLAFETPENLEVTDGTALMYRDANGLADHLRQIVEDPGSPDWQALRDAAVRRAATTYSWEAVTRQYEELFERLLGDVRPSRRKRR
jgi:glycosyltransferase involved in cell wall biosynthesis